MASRSSSASSSVTGWTPSYETPAGASLPPSGSTPPASRSSRACASPWALVAMLVAGPGLTACCSSSKPVETSPSTPPERPTLPAGCPPDRSRQFVAAQASWVYSGTIAAHGSRAVVVLPQADLRALILDRRDWAGWARALHAAGGFRD